MREILFRAKRLDNGEWVEGFVVARQANTYPDGFEIIETDGINYDELDFWQPAFQSYGVYPETICQYTGLTDKNGNKIWENDVVEAWSDGTMACGKVQQRIDGTWIMYPAWQNKTMWYFIPNEFGETTVEVIGNIFDNPELTERMG